MNRSYSTVGRRVCAGGFVAALLGVACVPSLEEGTLGLPRVVGSVRGKPPLEVIAPTSDRSGNLYILAGSKARPDLQLFVGQAGGGFVSGCRLTKDDTIGVHGWVGRAQERSWYWSGRALVAVNGRTGDCKRVLDRDPSTGSDLSFRAVLPWVSDTPSLTSVVALVDTPTDATPFTVRVDLNAGIYTTPRPFEPAFAREVVIHGVGAHLESKTGVALLGFKVGPEVRTEVRFFGPDGESLASGPVSGGGTLTPYSVRGFLAFSKDGFGAGVLNDKRIVVFSRAGGQVRASLPDFDAVGAHSRSGNVFLAGTSPRGAAIVRLGPDGAFGPVEPYTASARAGATLSGPVEVTDDRAPPRRAMTFDAPKNAIGPFPFVGEHSPDAYSDNATLLLIGGATYGEGANVFTQIAVAPYGYEAP